MRLWYRENAEGVRVKVRSSRVSRLDAVREYDRLRSKERKRKIDPMKKRARSYIENAVYHGRIVRGSCEVCGSVGAEAHHDDYSRPKDVRWLCRTHHMELHRTVT